MIKILLIISLLFSAPLVFAKKKRKKTGDTLSFEATIIEGERKKPTIFLDINIDKYSDIDSVLLMRRDFNDYHKVDRNKRPLFIE